MAAILSRRWVNKLNDIKMFNVAHKGERPINLKWTIIICKDINHDGITHCEEQNKETQG